MSLRGQISGGLLKLAPSLGFPASTRLPRGRFGRGAWVGGGQLVGRKASAFRPSGLAIHQMLPLDQPLNVPEPSLPQRC